MDEQSKPDHELLSCLLKLPASHCLALLEANSGLSNLARKTKEELTSMPGLGVVLSERLLAAFELGRRAAVPSPDPSHSLASARDVAEWFRCRLQAHIRESFHVLLLDGRNRPKRHITVAEGSWNACPLDPKLLFSACLRHACPSIILVHNHPSGDPQPSRDDIKLTERLVKAGRLLGIRILDHLVVGREGYCSLAEAGLM